MEILIVKLSALGDVIHTLPSVRALRSLYPAAKISWVVEEAASDILVGNPDLDRIIISRRKKWIENIKNFDKLDETRRQVSSFLKDLKDRSYDLVIDFQGLFKSAFLVFLTKSPIKLGYDSMQELSGLFYTDKIREDLGKHAVDRYLDFPRHLGASVGEPQFIIQTDHENEIKVNELLAQNMISSKDKIIAVSPVALWDTKLWDNHSWAALCDRIIKELGIKLIFVGDGSRSDISEIKSSMSAQSIDLDGQTSLRDLATLFRQADLVLTTDSGPMHLAAALGKPVIALFGPTSPGRTGPYGKGHTIIRKDLECSPCFLKKCESRRCMTEISVEEIFRVVKNKI